MYIQQSIRHPHGVTVFGSYLIRVDPDYVTLSFAVSRTMAKPSDAFSAVREGIRSVRECMSNLAIPDKDIRTSNLSLEQAWEGHGEARKMVGYRAISAFHVFITDLARVETLLSAVVEAGVDRIDTVHYRTKRLRELRAEARTRATANAKRKAEDYVAALGASLGNVIHIEDVNPETIASRRSHMPDIDLSAHDEDGGATAENPGAVVVAGAVVVSFAIVSG